MERGNLVYSTMNNAVTVPELIRISHGRHSVDSSVTVAHPQQLPRNTSENVESDNPASRPRSSSTENVEKMPERPQDLINKVSFGVAKVNFKSSAQYRKSYAFKIWREKGCFPFRLEDRPSSEDQKKSKRYLNAVKAQRDRNNEDAWRAYKSSKAKKAPTATQRPSEAVEVVGNTRSEGHHQTPFTASKDAVTKRNPVHSNNIPCYFKAKKDVSQKNQVTPVTMAIPTSVIHVNTTKSGENHQQITQVGQGSAHTTKEFRNQQFAKDNTTVPTTAGDQAAARKERSSVSEESTRILPNTLVHWSGETTSRISSKRLSQPPQIDGHTIAPTRTSIYGHQSNETRSCMKSSAEVIRLHGTQHEERLSVEKISTKNHLHSTDKAGQFAHQHEKSDSLNVKDDRNRGISVEKELEIQPETLPQKGANDGAQETNGHHLSTSSSNMVSIIKSTLNKKYCKENVKPGPERRKRRRENAATETGEAQRGRSAKQSKTTVFTRLDETVATNLADGIHSVNSEYFPIATLANKAAKEASEKIVRSEVTKMSIKTKVEEIDRAR